jgi:hypothetical protein
MARGCQVWVSPGSPGSPGLVRSRLTPRSLVGSLLEPSVYGLSAIPDMTANPIAGWPVALVPPAVQGMNWNAQHFRDIRERHELVSCRECHDHLPSRGYLVSGQAFGPSSQRGELGEGAGAFAQAARPDRSNSHRSATVKRPKSRNDSGRSRQELNSHDQLGRSRSLCLQARFQAADRARETPRMTGFHHA